MSSGKRVRQMWCLVLGRGEEGIERTGYGKREMRSNRKRSEQGSYQISDMSAHIIHSCDRHGLLSENSFGGAPEKGPPVNPSFIDIRCCGGRGLLVVRLCKSCLYRTSMHIYTGHERYFKYDGILSVS